VKHKHVSGKGELQNFKLNSLLLCYLNLYEIQQT
jgi:hypothetical protein